MALGTVTSLGVGSSLDLQDMLDSLREVDESVINLKETEKTRLEEQVVEIDALNAKILTMKSSALSLSLDSNFLEKTVTSSNEEVLTATATTGSENTSYTIEVTQLATKSSWQSEGVESADSLLASYPSTGIEESTDTALTEATTLSFTIGYSDDPTSVSISLDANSTLEDVVNAINTSEENMNEDGETYVTASIVSSDEGYYIRLASTDEDTSVCNQILVSEGPSFISPDVTFSYQIGTNDETYISVPPGTTYSEVAEIINDDPSNTGITASVIDDGTGDASYRLILTAQETGEDNRISLNGLTMEEVQGSDISLNAEFTINGITYQRQSNSDIDDVEQGLTLNLNEVGTATITTSTSLDTIKEEIQALFDVYNEVIETISTNSTYDEDADEQGLFYDVSAVKALKYDLTRLLGTVVDTGGSITSLYDLGMEFNEDGTITLDDEVFEEAFSSNAEEIQLLFLGDEDNDIEGLGDILNDTLRSMSNDDGRLALEANYKESKIERLEESIETATERLDKKYEILAERFVELDTYVGVMEAQADYLESLFASMTSSDD